MEDILLVMVADIEAFVLSKGISLSGDFSEDPYKDPVEVASRYMAAWLGYDAVVIER